MNSYDKWTVSWRKTTKTYPGHVMGIKPTMLEYLHIWRFLTLQPAGIANNNGQLMDDTHPDIYDNHIKVS